MRQDDRLRALFTTLLVLCLLVPVFPIRASAVPAAEDDATISSSALIFAQARSAAVKAGRSHAGHWPVAMVAACAPIARDSDFGAHIDGARPLPACSSIGEAGHGRSPPQIRSFLL